MSEDALRKHLLADPRKEVIAKKEGVALKRRVLVLARGHAVDGKRPCDDHARRVHDKTLPVEDNILTYVIAAIIYLKMRVIVVKIHALDAAVFYHSRVMKIVRQKISQIESHVLPPEMIKKISKTRQRSQKKQVNDQKAQIFWDKAPRGDSITQKDLRVKRVRR